MIYADRLYSMILEQSKSLDKLDNIIFIQINLNAVDKLDAKKEKLKYGTDRLVTYGVNSNKTYNNNKFVLLSILNIIELYTIIKEKN